jgi:hypothetical protein
MSPTRRKWRAEVGRNIEALGCAVVVMVQHCGLVASHEAAYLEHCRRYAWNRNLAARVGPAGAVFRPTLMFLLAPDAAGANAGSETVMELFKCQGAAAYFENTRCERCSRQLGYTSKTATLSALEPENASWRTVTKPRRLVRFCENAAHDVCNVLMDEDSVGTLCAACCHNHTIPDLAIGDNLRRWRRLELAKHWLFYALQRLRLPLQTRLDDPEHGLAFDFLADSPSPTGPKVLTGHDNCLIPIAQEEADVERERRHTDMREPYRSLLGHFRHEVGHYFWDAC